MVFSLFIIVPCVVLLLAIVWYSLKLDKILSVNLSANIAGDMVDVFNTVHNLGTWRYWNSWAQHELNIVTSFSDIAEGVGARLSWRSRYIGEGVVHNKRVQAYDIITQEVKLLAPYTLAGTVNWRFTPSSVSGLTSIDVNLNVKVCLPWYLKWKRSSWHYHLHDNCKFLLALLGNYACHRNESPSSDNNIYKIDFIAQGYVEPCTYVYESFSGTMENVSANALHKLGEIFSEIDAKGGKITNYPFCLYRSDKNDKVECEIAIPVEVGFSLARYKVGKLPKVPVTQTKLLTTRSQFTDAMIVAWRRAKDHFVLREFKPRKKIVGIEVYISDFANASSGDLVESLLLIPYKP